MAHRSQATTGMRSISSVTWWRPAASRSAWQPIPRSTLARTSRESDRRHLADKLRIADFAITQFFFEVDHYLRLVDELEQLGVDKPIVPGIMPVTNIAQIQRMAQMSGAELPRWLTDGLEAADSADQVRRIGVDVASKLCADLLAAGAPGIHLYTLNRADVARQIHVNLESLLV